MSRPEILSHEKHLDRIVARAIAHGFLEFNELLARVAGAFPTEVRESLSRLGMEVQIGKVKRTQRGSELPTPHPGDCAWRFSADTSLTLARMCIDLTDTDARLAILGAPEVFLCLRRIGSSRTVLFLDHDPLVLDYVSRDKRVNEEIYGCDLQYGEIPTFQANCIVMDPPWYLSEYHAFAWCAGKISASNSFLLSPLPGSATRPGMVCERRQILRLMHQLGYSSVGRVALKLAYQCPPFEQNALAAAGVIGVDPFWRQCDLGLYRKLRQSFAVRPLSSARQRWKEVVVGAARIRVLDDAQTDICSPQLEPLISGNILPSVSSRHPLRSRIKVWTSGNRVFGCKSPELLLAIFEALNKKRCPEREVSGRLKRELTAEERVRVRETVEQLNELLVAEENDSIGHCEP